MSEVLVTKREQKAMMRLAAGMPLMLRDIAQPNHCILATRLAVDALQSHGIRATALVVKTVAVSPELFEHIQNGGKAGPDAPGWSVGIGYGGEMPGFDGHLIVNVRNRAGMDLTISQATREQHGMELEPSCFSITEGFVKKGEPLGISHGDSFVVYEAQPERKDYATAPDWSQTLKRYPDLVTACRLLAAGANK